MQRDDLRRLSTPDLYDRIAAAFRLMQRNPQAAASDRANGSCNQKGARNRAQPELNMAAIQLQSGAPVVEIGACAGVCGC
jgi:hypothetical protein